VQFGTCFVQTDISTLNMYAVGFFEMFVHLNHQTKERQLHEDGNLDIQRH